MSAAGIVCGIAGGWIILATLGATVPHRLRRKHARTVRPHWATYPPAVPAPRPQGDAWMALVSADCLNDDDPLLHERFEAIVGAERWFTA